MMNYEIEKQFSETIYQVRLAQIKEDKYKEELFKLIELQENKKYSKIVNNLIHFHNLTVSKLKFDYQIGTSSFQYLLEKLNIEFDNFNMKKAKILTIDSLFKDVEYCISFLEKNINKLDKLKQNLDLIKESVHD